MATGSYLHPLMPSPSTVVAASQQEQQATHSVVRPQPASLAITIYHPREGDGGYPCPEDLQFALWRLLGPRFSENRHFCSNFFHASNPKLH
uniref:Uncharacterized protein n=1 Tax=Panagrellus redivivus TaxID=6233 RepID=A0A7E4V0S8_PANRE